MKSPLAAAAVLLIGLAACAPALRGPAVAAVAAPDRAANGPAASANFMDQAENDAGAADWADAALGRPGAVDGGPLSAADVRAALDASSSADVWDIAVLPYASDDRVEHYVDVFSGRARDYFAERLRRGTRYEPMIRGKLRAAGMPEDLFFLALVESGFDPHAYSRAAAVGMWQFMTTTARGVGLRVDSWVDERRDPVRATDAAIRHLRYLKSEFGGSTYLAAAAYNGGAGRVSRGLSQHADVLRDAGGEDRFFVLASTGYLRDETRDYVPQLIAAALIAKSPAVYGLLVEPLPPFAYDSARVAGGTPLAAVAEASGATLAEILDLNGQFLRGATPPGDVSLVRLPVGAGESFAARLAALPAARREGFTHVTTPDNGRLSRIAARHGLTEERLAAFNPGLRRNRRGLLVGGQRVLVPSRLVLGAMRDVPDPSIERYGTSAGAPVEAPAAATKAKRAPRTYTVRAGDALERIARAHDLTVAQLRRLNDLESSTIRPGQKLIVDGEATPPSAGRSRRAGTASRAAASRASSKAGTARRAPARTTSTTKATAPKRTAKPAASGR